MRKILQLIPDVRFLNILLVYVTSVFFHKSFTMYFSKTLNGFILRSKTESYSLNKYADKLEAKKYIEDTIGKLYVVKTLATGHENIPDNPFWAFKSNFDFSGALLRNGNELIDVKKRVFPTHKQVDERLNEYLNKFSSASKNESPFHITREACYKNITPKFFFEEYLPSEKKDGSSVDEYKFHCVNGKVEFVYLVHQRNNQNKRFILNPSGKILDVTWCKSRDLSKFYHRDNEINLSVNFRLMKTLAEKLSVKFKYVRVDFYDLDEIPKVGELTFFHGSGLEPITPKSFDKDIGKKIFL